MGSLTYKVREPLFRLQRYEKYYHYKQKIFIFKSQIPIITTHKKV